MLLTITIAMVVEAQQAMDFVGKFMTVCEGDSMVKCITVSPKMMEQLVKMHDDNRSDNIIQAIAKLKSARIVTAPTEYYERAELLIKKYASRFKAEQEFQTDEVRGTFYTRQDKKGRTAELIMLREDNVRKQMTIVCLTGDIDKEFLCFLYNNKSLKD